MIVKFRLITYNPACTYIIKKPDLSPRLARLAIQLADYDFEIIHQAGKQNVVADALSHVEILSVESCSIDELTRNQQRRDYFLGPVLLYLEKGKFPQDTSKAKANQIVADSKQFKWRFTTRPSPICCLTSSTQAPIAIGTDTFRSVSWRTIHQYTPPPRHQVCSYSAGKCECHTS